MNVDGRRISVPANHGKLVSIDLTDDAWIGAFRGASQTTISGSRWQFPLPVKTRFPVVRILPDDRVLVVDRRTDGDENGWILACDGSIGHAFFAGDGIQDVLIGRQHIIITYFDEGVFDGPPSSDGVVIFDFAGTQVFGYSSEFRGRAANVVDCYAACLGPDDMLWFLPYTQFPLVGIDLFARTQTILTLPKQLAGCHAVTTKDGESFVFHGPYGDKTGLFLWQLGMKRPNRFAEIEGDTRGLPGLRLLSFAESSYTVITFPAA